MTGGLFITFEGCDGSGKTTQAHRLAQYLRDCNPERDVVVTREPSDHDPVAARLREMVFDKEVHSMALNLVFLANRAHHVNTLVRPALDRGAFVICDRFIHSTLAYQDALLGMPKELTMDIHDWVTGRLMPDIVVYLDVPPRIGLSRQANTTHFEARGDAFQGAVRAAYQRMFAAPGDPHSLVYVNADKDIDSVTTEVFRGVAAAIERIYEFRAPLPLEVAA